MTDNVKLYYCPYCDKGDKYLMAIQLRFHISERHRREALNQPITPRTLYALLDPNFKYDRISIIVSTLDEVQKALEDKTLTKELVFKWISDVENFDNYADLDNKP
jgi:hypothetical protein